jgi:hypothetical protein
VLCYSNAYLLQFNTSDRKKWRPFFLSSLVRESKCRGESRINCFDYLFEELFRYVVRLHDYRTFNVGRRGRCERSVHMLFYFVLVVLFGLENRAGVICIEVVRHRTIRHPFHNIRYYSRINKCNMKEKPSSRSLPIFGTGRGFALNLTNVAHDQATLTNPHFGQSNIGMAEQSRARQKNS